ncbi:hypothetical protein ACWGCI_02560 [Streptomyces sp. NPDC054949]
MATSLLVELVTKLTMKASRSSRKSSKRSMVAGKGRIFSYTVRKRLAKVA